MDNSCIQCGCESYMTDPITGDESCASCGFVIATYAIVETYNVKCRDENNPDVVECAPKASVPVSRQEYRAMSTKDRNIYNAQRDIKVLCDRMLLSNAIKEEAIELVVQYEKTRSHHSRKADQALLIGILYLASKHVNQSISIDRLCRDSGLADNTVEIKRLYQDVVKKALNVDDDFLNICEFVPATVAPIKSKLMKDWIPLFESYITCMAKYCDEKNLGDRRPRPVSIILACTYLVIERFELDMTLSEVVKTYNEETGSKVALNTVSTCITKWKPYKDAILSIVKL